jgi:Reverse transcriptase (RNA-dependent DNA polymerase)
MKSGFEPKSFKTYNLTPEEQVELNKFLKENLDKGYIKPSQSPMASPFFFVKKKDEKLRPCQDYRYLNDWTVKNTYPLPLISEIMDKIKGAKFFTKFDVRWGYNNVRIKAKDQWKAAFKTNRGLFEPMVMFFGMCNSPATFQAMMDSIFSNMIEG